MTSQASATTPPKNSLKNNLSILGSQLNETAKQNLSGASFNNYSTSTQLHCQKSFADAVQHKGGASAQQPTLNSLLSQSVPATTSWDEYQRQVFQSATSSSDSDNDDSDLSRMVDWVVGGIDDDFTTAASPSFAAIASPATGRQGTSQTPIGKSIHSHAESGLYSKSIGSTASFMNPSNSSSYQNHLLQHNSPAYLQHFPKPSMSKTMNGAGGQQPTFDDHDDLTFDISDLDLDPMSFGMGNQGGSYPLRPAQGGFQTNTSMNSAAYPRKMSSSEHTPTASFRGLSGGGAGGGSGQEGSIGLLSPQPPSHGNFPQKYKYGTSPTGHGVLSSSPNNGTLGTSPMLINSFVGSGNAMRPNGLLGTSLQHSNMSGLLASSFDGSNLLADTLLGSFSNSRVDACGLSTTPTSSGTLLPPGRVVGGMVLENASVARSELAEDGCPILKLPRMPFLGIPGTMEIPHRVWKKGGTEKPDNRHFMIMSYNLLAPMYCTDSRYFNANSNTLDWDRRKQMILDEIAFYSPDFICLQELPPSDFKSFFLPHLQKLGYDGHFQQKKRDHAADGCGTFYLEARFTLLAVQAFAYNDQVPQDVNSDLYKRLSPFPNIALVCVFQNRQARSLRCRIVNTHLHWDPQYSDTKLLQAAILMEWLERSPHRDVPTAIAADLNSRAGEAVVDYLVRGKVAPGALFQGKDFGRFTKALTVRNPMTGVTVLASNLAEQPGFENLLNGGVVIQNPNLPQVINPVTGQLQPPQQQVLLPLLRHGTKLASAYDRKDLPFTNKTPEFEGTIDHILYTSGTLSIRDVLGDFDQTYYPNASATTGETEGAETHSSDDEKPVVKVGEGEEKENVTPTAADPIPPSVEAEHPASAPGPETGSADPLVPGAYTTPRPYHHHQPPPPVGYLAKISSFPTPHIPSDHLPLCAWLKWKTVPVGTGPINNSINHVLNGAANGSGGLMGPNGVRSRGGGGNRRLAGGGGSGGSGNHHGHASTHMHPQNGQSVSMLSTSAPNRAVAVPNTVGGANMSQVQVQLFMQHQQQQQQQQPGFQVSQGSNNQQGGVSALSMGLMGNGGSRGYTMNGNSTRK